MAPTGSDPRSGPLLPLLSGHPIPTQGSAPSVWGCGRDVSGASYTSQEVPACFVVCVPRSLSLHTGVTGLRRRDSDPPLPPGVRDPEEGPRSAQGGTRRHRTRGEEHHCGQDDLIPGGVAGVKWRRFWGRGLCHCTADPEVVPLNPPLLSRVSSSAQEGVVSVSEGCGREPLPSPSGVPETCDKGGGSTFSARVEGLLF